MGKLTKYNIEMLKSRVIDSLENSKSLLINNQLKNIKGATIITGVGGSLAVCYFLQKVLNQKNGIVSIVVDPRDLSYINLNIYSNIISVSYSGNNYGVKLAMQTNIKNKYILTNKEQINSIHYKTTIEEEKSFISLGATLIPITILLNYYLDSNYKFEYADDLKYNLPSLENITIIYGYESKTAANFLNTTLIEAGIASPILGTKYNYCHGQTTLPYHHNHDLIFFKSSDNELDETILKEANNLYHNITIIETNKLDVVTSDYDLLLKTISLVYQISIKYKKDLSIVKYAPAVKSLYYFKGSI